MIFGKYEQKSEFENHRPFEFRISERKLHQTIYKKNKTDGSYDLESKTHSIIRLSSTDRWSLFFFEKF